MKYYIFATLLLFHMKLAYASSDHAHDHPETHHGSSKAVGKGKAITENSKEEGIKLSPKAIANLKVSLMSANAGLVEIPRKALVKKGNETFVYRYRNGHFKMIAAKVMIDGKQTLKVKVADREFGDQIVVDGVELIRVSDTYANDEAEYGHSH